MTAIAMPMSAGVAFRPTRRTIAAMVLALLSFALVATPTTDVVADITPEVLTSAVSAVVPDFVADLFTAQQADAWGWRAVASAFTGVVIGAVVGGTCAAAAVGATGGVGAGAVVFCSNFGAGAGVAAASLWY